MSISKVIGLIIGLLIGFVIGFILASYWNDPGFRPALRAPPICWPIAPAPKIAAPTAGRITPVSPSFPLLDLDRQLEVDHCCGFGNTIAHASLRGVDEQIFGRNEQMFSG